MELGTLCSYALTAGGKAAAQKKVGKQSNNGGKKSSKQKQQQPKAAAAATTATTASRVLVEVPRQQTSELFYITTAINYTNGPPHIGHAYEGITTDIIARYHRTYGRIVEFLTGTDEHGTKIAQTAEQRTELLKTASPEEIEALEKKWKMKLHGKKIIEPIDICDHYAAGFKKLNVALSVESDKFIRTTEDYHKKTAQTLFSKCLARGDIYLGQYKGWYNVKEEQYVTPQEAEATEFKDPASGVPYEWREEPSYYFRMGNYQAQLLEHITKNPGFIQPEKHRNLIKKRLEDDKLLDLSISRHISKLKHGVPLPNDKEHVMYVWFDALTNYISGLGWPSAKCDKFFPTCTHIIGKDILWFHCVIWPCMLMSGEVPLPKTIFGHGWVLDKNGKKMSKSIGNVVDPWDVVAKFPLDTLRLYLARETTYGNDLRFSIESLVNLNNSELADTLGNLVNRLTKLAKGQVPDVPVTESGTQLPFNIAGVKADVDACFAEYNLKGATEVILTALRDTNKWIADAKPWTIKDKAEKAHRGGAIVRLGLEALYVLAHFFAPFMPNTTAAIEQKLGHKLTTIIALKDDFQNLVPGTTVVPGAILFPAVDMEGNVISRYTARQASGASAKQAAKAAQAARAAKGNKQTSAVDLNDPRVKSLKDEVAKLGASIRAAKAAGKDKSAYIPLVEKMNSIKAQYQDLTGLSLDPKKKSKKKKNPKPAQSASAVEVDPFAQLEIRVGKITKVWHHPDIEKLFCEEIDIGAKFPRTVASGLREHYKLEDMNDRRVLVVCNLPKRNMGKSKFPSLGMVLCAQKNVDGKETVELVAPPADAALGDRISVPDIKPVKPLGSNKIKRQKVLEKVLEHLRTNSDRCVTYKGVAVQTSTGPCSVASLNDAKVV